MESAGIVKWITGHSAPIRDSLYGDRYRCAAILNDGLHLPCVVISSAKAKVELAVRRFDETRRDTNLHPSVGYRSIVADFVTGGNTLNHCDIKALLPSDFAVPLPRLSEINGETSMAGPNFTP